MKLTTAILAVGMMTSGAWAQNPNAQNPNVINNVQSTMTAVQQQKTNDSNAALGTKGGAAKPAPKPAAGAPAKATSTPTPAAAKNAAPAASAKPQTAPQAKAVSTPAPAPAAGKKAAAPVAASAKPQAGPQVKVASTPMPGPAKNTGAPVAVSVKLQTAPQTKPSAKKTATTAVAKPTIAVKQAPQKKAEKKTVISAAPTTKEGVKPAEAAKSTEAPKPPKQEEKKWAMSGKRDPFFSPVVQQPTGSGCSSGKKCLEIGQINLRGVVKSDSGFIAVVTNNLNKAYFLHENDPVFNGYVLRITGDTVVFQETFQDNLGKSLTREVVKRISTPAV
jgi:hypothetical protein